MRIFLVLVFLALFAGLMGGALWWNAQPEKMLTLKLCERSQVLEFDQRKKAWVRLPRPLRSVIVCEMPKALSDPKVEGLDDIYTYKPLPGRSITVPCFKNARMQPGTLPIRMSGGLFCNVPTVVKADRK